MGLQEDILEDVDDVFFNGDFSENGHTFCGKKMEVIVDEKELEEINKTLRNQNWKNEVEQCSVLLFAKESDMERNLSVDSRVEYDEDIFYVKYLSKKAGIWKIGLGRNRV